jgi:decaprenylphospho-beta-D-erythro-pentofuranosid-2-ulose 2-reductase
MGGLDLVIYVAGVQPAVAPGEYNFEKDAAMVRVNLLGAMAWLNETAVRFERAGQVILWVRLNCRRPGGAPPPGYNTSKAALATYLEALRNRLSRHGVTVTTIKPGFVDTVCWKTRPRRSGSFRRKRPPRKYIAPLKRKSRLLRARPLVAGRPDYRNIPSFIFRRLSI